MREESETTFDKPSKAYCAVILSLIFTSLLIIGSFHMPHASAAPPKVATPTFSPPGGTYSSVQTVTIKCSTTDATIRYTVDGTTPSSESTVYTTPILVSVTTTIKARAFLTGWTDSSTASATYTINLPKVAKPTFSPGTGTYSSPQYVTIQCATAGATIRYTIDGSEPSSSSTVYSSPLMINETTTVRAKAFRTGMTDSDTASATYTIKVFAPTISPSGGSFSNPQTVMISCATTGATIRYTTNGVDPTSTTGTAYSGPLSVGSSMTLKAKAFKSGMMESDVAAATFTFKASTPTFSPAGGTYSSPQNVVLSCATTGATIRYTTDGSTPSSSSTAYSSPITVNANITVKAKAFMTGMTDSDTASATYTINLPPPKVETPTFSPAGGIYSSSQNVTLSCGTSGATMRYTADGSEPTISSGEYSRPISIVSTTIVKAKAFKSGMTDSDTAQETYTITAEPEPNKVATPIFTPGEGTYSSPQNVALSCDTPGATIRYTVDGSEPYSSSSAVYTSPISVFASTTIKARAFAAGMIDSDTASATYNITANGKVATPTFNPVGGSYSNAQAVAIECATPGAVIRYTTTGLYPESYSPLYTGPISVGVTTTIMAKAFAPGLEDSDVAYATYTINTDTSSQEPPSELDIWLPRIAIALFATVLVMSGVLVYFGQRKKTLKFHPVEIVR